MTVECLNSYIPALTNSNIKELIILDNNSNKDLKDFLFDFQNTNEICKEKVKVIYSNKNLGVCHGRRILFKEATGSIIASLDSDAKLLNIDFFNMVITKLYQENIGIASQPVHSHASLLCRSPKTSSLAHGQYIAPSQWRIRESFKSRQASHPQSF
jgi:glycosyltransferase involved in cell wall biosynthesis